MRPVLTSDEMPCFCTIHTVDSLGEDIAGSAVTYSLSSKDYRSDPILIKHLKQVPFTCICTLPNTKTYIADIATNPRKPPPGRREHEFHSQGMHRH